MHSLQSSNSIKRNYALFNYCKFLGFWCIHLTFTDSWLSSRRLFGLLWLIDYVKICGGEFIINMKQRINDYPGWTPAVCHRNGSREREREREIMQLWDVGKSNRSDDDDYVDDMEQTKMFNLINLFRIFVIIKWIWCTVFFLYLICSLLFQHFL